VRRLDTLFTRMFLLLLIAIAGSSFLAVEAVRAIAPPQSGGCFLNPPRQGANTSGVPAVHASTDCSRPPWWSVALDLSIRIGACALGAWWAARFLSDPMQKLSNAARSLSDLLAPATSVGIATEPPQLDQENGTREVRFAAKAFNEMSSRLKRDFDAQRLLLASVSHDLRTPIARLRLRLEGLDGHPVAAKAIEDVRQMDEMIESILALFRPDEASVESLVKIDVLSLLHSMVDDIPFSDASITVQGSPLTTTCRPAALRRMVQNLLENSLLVSSEVELDVRSQGDMLEVRVSDRGPGLSDDEIDVAGTPFTRSYKPQIPAVRRGFGLGLYIVRALAEREGGSLNLSRRYGGGLVALVRLPIST
jgi:signal transduction histidine kinase